MEAEVEWAIKQLKGQDGIPIEMIKAGDGEMTKTIKKICNKHVVLWTTGKWPEDWKSFQSLFLYLKRET